MPPSSSDMSAPATSTDELREEVERLRLLHCHQPGVQRLARLRRASPRRSSTGFWPRSAPRAGSIWIAEGDMLRCRLAVGGRGDRLVGAEVPVGTGFVGDVAQQQKTTIVTRAQEDPRFQPDVDRSDETLAINVMATAMVAEGVTVGAIQVTNKVTGDGMFDQRRPRAARGPRRARGRVAAERPAARRRASGPATWRSCSTSAARSPRRWTSTGCSNRWCTWPSRALPFDRGAVGLYEKGHCDIRAVAGRGEGRPQGPQAAGPGRPGPSGRRAAASRSI